MEGTQTNDELEKIRKESAAPQFRIHSCTFLEELRKPRRTSSVRTASGPAQHAPSGTAPGSSCGRATQLHVPHHPASGPVGIGVPSQSSLVISKQDTVGVGVLLAADSQSPSSSGYQASLWDP
jgi:hypothetical protein